MSGFRELSVQLPYEPVAEPQRDASQLLVDPESGNGFILASQEATSADDRETTITPFDSDTLVHGSKKTLNFALRWGLQWNTLRKGIESPTAVGNGKLYLTDQYSNVRVVDQESLALETTFPAPLPTERNNLNEKGPEPWTTPNGRREPIAHHAWVRIGAMAFWPDPPGTEDSGGKLLILTESDSSADEPGHVTALSLWDAETGRELWVARLDACRSQRSTAITPRYGLGLAVGRHPNTGQPEAVVGCIGGSNTAEVWRVALREDRQGIEGQIRVARVVEGHDFFFDLQGRRAVVATLNARRLVGVDLDRRGVNGVIQTAFERPLGSEDPNDFTSTSVGIDSRSGRVYFLAPPSREQGGEGSTLPGGIGLVDARRSPLPQPFTAPELNPDGRNGIVRIVVDSATKEHPTRVFVRYQGEDFYRVFEDTRLLSADVPFGAVDELTTNVPEKEGVTRAAFNAGSSAYGARAIFVSGLYSVPESLNRGNRSETRSNLEADPQGAPNRCMTNDREVTLGVIDDGTNLADTGTSAEAVAVDADPGTIQDLESPAGNCPFDDLGNTFSFIDGHVASVNEVVGEDGSGVGLPHDVRKNLPEGVPEPEVPDLNRESIYAAVAEPVDQVVGRPWGFSSAICSRGQTDETPKDGDTVGSGVQTPDTFSAAVECSADGESVTGVSRAGAMRVGDLSVGEVETTTTISREFGIGVEVVTAATARNVGVSGVFNVAHVESRAVSRAGGRPGTATTEFQRRWCGFALAGERTDGACLDPDSPEGEEFVAGVNRLLDLRGYRLVVPSIDAEFAGGTPRGAFAGVEKDQALLAGDRLFNNDDSAAVPGLQVEHYHDTPDEGRGRQIYQLAGVRAQTSYFISLIPQGVFLPFEAPEGSPLPAVLGETATAPAPAPAPRGNGPREVFETIPAVDATPPAVAPPASGGLGDGLYALGRGLRWLLRNPLEALKVTALIAGAFALPLYLFERRRQMLASLNASS